MAITYISSTETIVGSNHPTLADTKNRAGQYINTQMLVAHDANGQHIDRQKALTGLLGSFSGNGAARTISLSNANLTPYLVEAWEYYIGGELITNGGFDSDTADWTTSGTCAIASIAGGASGNCGEITTTGTNEGGAKQTIALLKNHAYLLSFSLKSGTSGAGNINVQAGGYSELFASTGAWVAHTMSIPVAVATSADVLLVKIDAVAGTMLIDSVSVTEVSAPQYIRLSTMDSGKSCKRADTTMLTSGLGNFTTGGFAIPAASGINNNGVTNYYYVAGIDLLTNPVGDSGAGSDPTWIPSAITSLMYGDGTGGSATNWANSVEGAIETAFLHEHIDAGTHNPNPYTGFGRIEAYTYTGNGADSRTITLQDPSLNIAELLVISAGGVAWTKTETMAGDTTKLETTAAFAANYIESIGTGSFVVGTAANVNLTVYHYCAIGVL